MARLKGFEKLANVDEAITTFLKELKLKRMSPIQIPIHTARERVLAEDFVAKNDLPPFNRSAVDGYAVRAQETSGASQFSPRTLRLTMQERLDAKEARQTWTGNPLPQGADAVIMLELTRKTEERVEIWTPVTPGENVSKRGEDVRKGEVAIRTGTRLKPHHLGLLAAFGVTHINAFRKPKVALLSTGNELVEPGRKPKSHQTTDVNRLILSSMCQEIGAKPLNLGIARDEEDEITTKIQEGVERAQVIITTGGTSAGYHDLVPITVNRIGAPGVIVHGIAMRPGMPTALAIVQGKPIIMLSGNPVAAMVGFEVFARPLLLKLLGVESEPRPVLKAKLTRRVPSALGRRVFLRVHAFQEGGKFFAEPIRIKGAGVLTTMTKANGYVIIPEHLEGLRESESVIVHLFDKLGKTKHV